MDSTAWGTQALQYFGERDSEPSISIGSFDRVNRILVYVDDLHIWRERNSKLIRLTRDLLVKQWRSPFRAKPSKQPSTHHAGVRPR